MEDFSTFIPRITDQDLKQFNLPRNLAVQNSELLSGLLIVHFSREILFSISNVEDTFIENLRLYLCGSLELQAFIETHKFLTPEHFLSNIFKHVPSSQILKLAKQDLKRFPSLQSIDFDPSKNFLLFQFPQVTLIENFEVYLFVLQKLNPGLFLTGSVFSKGRYFVGLARSGRNWFLFKGNVRFKFNSWSLACAACYEDGFCISSLIFVKGAADDVVEATAEDEEMMKEIRDVYLMIPCKKNHRIS